MRITRMILNWPHAHKLGEVIFEGKITCRPVIGQCSRVSVHGFMIKWQQRCPVQNGSNLAGFHSGFYSCAALSLFVRPLCQLMEEHKPCLNKGCQNEHANPDEFICVIHWTNIFDVVDAQFKHKCLSVSTLFFNTADNECELMLNNWNESTWIVPTMTLIKHLNVLLTLVYT